MVLKMTLHRFVFRGSFEDDLPFFRPPITSYIKLDLLLNHCP